MGWFTEFFNYQGQKGKETTADSTKAFEDRLEAAQEKQAKQRKYASMDAKPKYRFSHLQMDPFYEQRNMMFPHRKYVRREGSS